VLGPTGWSCGNNLLAEMTPAEQRALDEQDPRSVAVGDEVQILFDRAEFGAAPSGCGPALNPALRQEGEGVRAWLGGTLSARAYTEALWGPDAGILIQPEQIPGNTIPNLWAWEDPQPWSGEIGLCWTTRAQTFRARDIASIARPDCLYLGPNTLAATSRYPELKAHVPADFQPTRSKAEMKWALWPRWMERCASAGNPDWESAAACVNWKGGPGPKGLFWDSGNGFEYRYLLHAVVTLNGFRTYLSDRYRFPAACGLSTEVISDYFRSRKKWIKNESIYLTAEAVPWMHIDGQGMMSCTMTTDADITAWAAFGTIRYNQSLFECSAAVADFYLWWAHRLYSYALDGSGTRLHLLMAWWCAQLAMAEVVTLAGLLVHELGHLTGSWWHCGTQEVTGWTVGADGRLEAELEDVPLYCCQYLSDLIFSTRVRAELGLPKAQMQIHGPSGVWYQPDQVLGRRNSSVWIEARGTGSGQCSSASNIAEGMVHQYLRAGSSSEVARALPKDCAPDIAAKATQQYVGVPW